MELRLDLREVLYVLGRRPQFVLAQVTTSTVAHSITLGLGIFVTAW